LPLPATAAELAVLFDHTLLKADATPQQVVQLCAEAKTHGFKGVCVNPCYVSLAARELAGTPQLVMATVGFPLGAARTDVKIDETLRAIGDGAREIDMVIGVGVYLGGDRTAARHDMAAVVRSARGAAVKVILETAYLSAPQIAEWCVWCAEAGAAQVKTSTGFGPRGASVEDVATMRTALAGTPAGAKVGIKASGGIRTLEQALALVGAGATRLGASASVKILTDFKEGLKGS
jgi:deoxyribose-phosphate aldolase